MKKALVALSLPFLGVLVACAPERLVVSFPDRSGESDLSAYEARYEAARASMLAADGCQIELTATGSFSSRSTSIDLGIESLTESLSMTAVGLNEATVDDLAIGLVSNGHLGLNIQSQTASQPTAWDTSLDSSIYVRDGRLYGDLTKINWEGLLGDTSQSLDAALTQKVVDPNAFDSTTPAEFVDDFRDSVDSLFFAAGENPGTEASYYAYTDGSIGFEAAIGKKDLALALVSFDDDYSPETAAEAAASLEEDLELRAATVKFAYGTDEAHGYLDLDFACDRDDGKPSYEVDMTIAMALEFGDDLDIDFPTDLDAYVEI